MSIKPVPDSPFERQRGKVGQRVTQEGRHRDSERHRRKTQMREIERQEIYRER